MVSILYPKHAYRILSIDQYFQGQTDKQGSYFLGKACYGSPKHQITTTLQNNTTFFTPVRKIRNWRLTTNLTSYFSISKRPPPVAYWYGGSIVIKGVPRNKRLRKENETNLDEYPEEMTTTIIGRIHD